MFQDGKLADEVGDPQKHCTLSNNKNEDFFWGSLDVRFELLHIFIIIVFFFGVLL